MALIVLYAPSPAFAQRAQLYTVLVKSGSEVVKILVEKRADLTVGIVSGALVTVMDKSMSAFFDDKEKDKKSSDPKNIYILNCSKLNDSMATCKDAVNIPGEKPLPLGDERIRTALSGAQSTLLFPGASTRELLSGATTLKPVTPPPAGDRTLLEVTFWWSIQSSKFAADYEDYITRFPNGEFAEIAKRRIAEIKGATVQPRMSGCSKERRAVLDPIHSLYEAMRTRSSSHYAAQWWDDASYRSYDGRVQLNKYELIADRQFLFGQWVEVRISNLQMSMSLDRHGMAIVRSTYDFYARDTRGEVFHNAEVESFLLACANDGRWKILDNVYYPN